MHDEPAAFYAPAEHYIRRNFYAQENPENHPVPRHPAGKAYPVRRCLRHFAGGFRYRAERIALWHPVADGVCHRQLAERDCLHGADAAGESRRSARYRPFDFGECQPDAWLFRAAADVKNAKIMKRASLRRGAFFCNQEDNNGDYPHHVDAHQQGQDNRPVPESTAGLCEEPGQD